MDNIIHPFPLPIYQNFIDNESFNIIKEDTYNFISQNQDSFERIWLCPTLTTQAKPPYKNIQSSTLKNQIKKHIEAYSKVWSFNEPYKLKIRETWVNIAPKHAYQEEHNHEKALFSGVLYINVNKYSGDFQFLNPLASEGILMGRSNKFGYLYNTKPQKGLILLFPGWLNHRVLPNKSDEDRISISFNIDRI